MSKYNIGDKFIIECKGYRKSLEAHHMSCGIMLDEETLDELEKYEEWQCPDYQIRAEREHAFHDGMIEAWNIARRIVGCRERGLNAERRDDLFGRTEAFDVLNLYDVYDAKNILKEYDEEQEKEKQRIHEGDVVEIIGHKAVVLAIDRDIASVYVIDNDDGKVQELPIHKLKKEGHSVDVRQVLVEAYMVDKGFKNCITASRILSKEECEQEGIVSEITMHECSEAKVEKYW